MSGTHGVFQHRSGYFYTILEEDFCEVYKTPGVNEVCRAYITSILEHLTNKQFEATGRDTDIWVYMSLPEMERRMRHACSQRTIHKELQGMIKEGFLFKRRAAGKATMEYKLNIKKLRKALEALPEVQPSKFATSYLANLQDQSSNSATLTLQNDKNHLANLQPRIHREETEDYTEITEEREAFAFAHDAHAFSENDYHFVEGNKHRAWNCLDWCNKYSGTCADYQAAIDAGWHETPTGEQAAIQMGATDGQSNDNHPTADRRAADSVRADGPGEPETSVEQTTPARSAPPSERNDGAATVRESSEPRASDDTLPDVIDVLMHPEKLHASQKPLSLKEDEPTVRPETPAQRKRRIEAREKEIWALVEAGLRTKFTKTHRQLKANTTGMERLIEDETNDETIKTALDRLSDFWKNQFDLAMFHAKLPGLVREQTPQRSGKLADKSPQSVRDVQYEAALQKIGQPLEQEEVPAWLDFDNYVGNGPEERKRWLEEGERLKALGYCPDL